jgi:hypothetical protein
MEVLLRTLSQQCRRRLKFSVFFVSSGALAVAKSDSVPGGGNSWRQQFVNIGQDSMTRLMRSATGCEHLARRYRVRDENTYVSFLFFFA